MNSHGRNRRLVSQYIASVGAGGAMAAVPFGAARAADWPKRPIKLIVPYSAGGPTDAIARMLAERMGTALGEPVVVEDRAGAGGPSA